jgi:hypothetical protein
MPLDPKQGRSSIISELLEKYKNTGKIGKTTPRSMKHAQKIAGAIAYSKTRKK